MSEINTKITVDTQELEDARKLIEDVSAELRSVVPNITIRNNQNVYVTINNFNETERQWAERKEEDVSKEPNDVALWGAVLQEVGAFIGRMINAQTVDAIPIEWIEETMRLAESVGAKEYAEHLEVLMADWAEEMEDVYVTLHHDDINFKDEESEKAFYEALEREEE